MTAPGEMTLPQFFEQVTAGLLQAQRALDAKSALYNQDYQRQLEAAGVPAPPVHLQFRIPTVRAKLNYEFQRTTEGGINLILFRAESNQTQRLTQEIEFTLETVPLPRTGEAQGSKAAPPPPKGGERGAAPTTFGRANRPDLNATRRPPNLAQLQRSLEHTAKHSDHRASKHAANALLQRLDGAEVRWGSKDTLEARLPNEGDREYYVLTQQAGARKGKKRTVIYDIETVAVR